MTKGTFHERGQNVDFRRRDHIERVRSKAWRAWPTKRGRRVLDDAAAADLRNRRIAGDD